MINFIKRFWESKGDLMFRICYAADMWSEIEKREFFMCESVKGGEWIKVTKYGNARKSDEN